MKCLFNQLFVDLISKYGLISTEDALNSHRYKTATSVNMIAKVKEIVKPMQDTPLGE
jgi:hypothetical protein